MMFKSIKKFFSRLPWSKRKNRIEELGDQVKKTGTIKVILLDRNGFIKTMQWSYPPDPIIRVPIYPKSNLMKVSEAGEIYPLTKHEIKEFRFKHIDAFGAHYEEV